MSDDKEKGLSVLPASVWPLDQPTPNIFSFADVLGPKKATSDEADEELGELVTPDSPDKLEWD